jgi:hypothetical protein
MKLKEKIKKFLIRLAYKFKCHPECDLEVPRHCDLCGMPNNRFHYDQYHKVYDEFDGKSYSDYKDALIYSMLSYGVNDMDKKVSKKVEDWIKS